VKKTNEDISLFLKIRWLRHVAFWATYLLSMTYIHGSGVEHGHYLPWLLNYLAELPILIALTYTIAYLMIEDLLLSRKYLQFAAYSVMSMLTFSYLNVVLDVFVILPHFFGREPQPENLNFMAVLRNAFGLLFPVVIFVFISNARNLYEAKRSKAKLGIENTQARLELLRNQVHPIFLRNALQDLYILSRKPVNNLAEMVLKISEILNYMIFECDKPNVRVENELAIVQQYLDFVEITTEKSFKSHIHIMGNARNFLISPYILFPLVRSACEYHGTEGKQNLQMAVNSDEKGLDLYLEKEISEKSGGYSDTAWRNEVQLAGRRLDLIYGFRHSLNIREVENSIRIELKIESENLTNQA